MGFAILEALDISGSHHIDNLLLECHRGLEILDAALPDLVGDP